MDQAELIERNQPRQAAIAALERMLKRLQDGQDSDFGGAVVIVPPINGGDPVETYIIDAKQDAAQFWSIVKTKSEMAIDSVMQAMQNQSAFGRR